MYYQRVVTLLIIIMEHVSAFHQVDINHLLLKLDRSHLNLSNVQEKWIEQPLDHFNPNETRTLRMRYFENLELWQQNGTIIIFIAGEIETYPDWIASSNVTLVGQLAGDTNGAMFAMEHRYYGKTLPNITQDNIIEYYKFLNSHQALADFAKLIKTVKSDLKFKRSKVVVVGGSYGGNLAAWLRELYPALVDVAVASSAPVLAKKDFHEYLDVVHYTLGKYGTKNCLKNIGNRYKRYEQLLKSNHGIETLKRELNICPSSDLTVLENQQGLFYTQYNKLMGELAQSYTPNDVKVTCSKYQNTSELHGGLGCLNVNVRLVKYTTPWLNQVCNEFGYFPSTSSEKKPFVHWNPVEFYLNFCKYLIKGDIGKTVDEGVSRTNELYGGRSPRVSKVVFTHGDMDPWKVLGVRRDLGPDAPVTIVNGTSHCTVLAIYGDEPRDLTLNREYVKRLVKQWISTP